MTELTTLKTLCDELDVTPREARNRLRAAVKDSKNFRVLTKAYKPGSLWQWPKGSDAEAEARKAVKIETEKK